MHPTRVSGTGRLEDDTDGDASGEDAARPAECKRKRVPAGAAAGVGSQARGGSTSSKSSQGGSRRAQPSEESNVESSGISQPARDLSSDEEIIAPAVQLPAPVVGVAPIETGAHARRRVERPPVALTLAEQVVGGLVYEFLSNSAGDLLIEGLKLPGFKAEGERSHRGVRVVPASNPLPTRIMLPDLPDSAATLKERIVRAASAEQPLFHVTMHPLTFAACEQQPPRKNWRGAAVANRGVLAALISAYTNRRTFDWNRAFHYDPAAPHAADPGVASEPFYASDCQRGCAQAIARGRALGWTGPILPAPVGYSGDATSPTPTCNTTLDPLQYGCIASH